MPADIGFYVGDNYGHRLVGSGLGFYGSGFGQSVAVGAFQDTTYVTNSAGTAQGIQGDNVKWVHPASGQVAGGVQLLLRDIPNDIATLNLRFTFDTAVKAQNAQVRIYDRVTTTRGASGVTTYIAEIIHPNPVQGPTGSGSTGWFVASGTIANQAFNLYSNPGISGLYNNQVSGRSDTRHDWYLAISASPDSIGSKTLYGLVFSLEYL